MTCLSLPTLRNALHRRPGTGFSAAVVLSRFEGRYQLGVGSEASIQGLIISALQKGLNLDRSTSSGRDRQHNPIPT